MVGEYPGKNQQKIFIGTSGYAYPEWKGILYPLAEPSSTFLPRYLENFDFLELNFSYYRIPTEDQIRQMVSSFRPGQCLSLKIHRSLTHERSPDPRADARVFLQAITPFLHSTLTGGLVCQFPFSFHYLPENRRYLAHCLQALEAVPAAGKQLWVEFRNQEWFSGKVLDALAGFGAAPILCDEPALPGLAGPLEGNPWFSMAREGRFPHPYFRMHGRNRENWWQGDNASRYDWLYSPGELDPVFAGFQDIARKCLSLNVAWNNHARGRAVVNARMCIETLNTGFSLASGQPPGPGPGSPESPRGESLA